MITLITLCIAMALFSFILFLYGLQQYIKSHNKMIYKLSLSILLMAVIWTAIGVTSYLNYIQQIRL